MNILKYFVLVPIIVFVILSCQKEQDEFKPENINLIDDSQFSLRNEISQSLSIVLKNNPSLLQLFSSSKNTIREYYDEIIFLDNVNIELTPSLSLGEAIFNNLEMGLNTFKDKEELYGYILENDPLLCFKVPDAWYTYEWNNSNVAPFIISFTDKDFTPYQLGMLKEDKDLDKMYLKIYVKESERNLLIDPQTFDISNGFYSWLVDYQEVREGLIKRSNNLYLSSSKLVNIYDLQDEFNELRGPVGPPIDYDPCDGIICMRDCGRDWNLLDGFELSNVETINSIGKNAPYGEMEEDYNFSVQFIIADRGDPESTGVTLSVAGHKKNLAYPLNQLLYMGSVDFMCEDLTSSGITYTNCWYETLTSPATKYVDLNLSLFGTEDGETNEWQFERYGDRVKVVWREVDHQLYNSGISESSTFTWNLGVTVSAKFPIIPEVPDTPGVPGTPAVGGNIGAGYTYSHTSNTQYTIGITAKQIVEMGESIVSYCDDQNHEFGDVPYNTGMVRPHFTYYLTEE